MKILMFTHRLPYAPNRGDRIRSFHLIRELSRDAELRVVSLVHDRDEAGQTAGLESLGVRVWTASVPRVRNAVRALRTLLLTDTPLTHALLDAPGIDRAITDATVEWRPDLLFVYCTGIAPAALTRRLGDVPMIVDFVDVDSAKWAALAATAAPPRSWVFAREARCLARFEARLARGASTSLVVNEREREALLRLCPGARAVAMQNGVDIEKFRTSQAPAANCDVVFSGVFDYAPNVDGAVWLAREVWPRVLAEVPSARLRLVGARPNRAVRRLAAVDESITVTGSVPDMRPHLWQSAVAVAPLFVARGVQNKVLEAVAARLPVVVTPAAWDGLPPEVLAACRCAGDAAAFANEVIALLSLTPEARRRMADRVQLAGLRWADRLAPLHGLVRRAAGPMAGGASAPSAARVSRRARVVESTMATGR
jgi:sugar transferase (PEP-CTERM/EpsH1 system associated)